MPDDSIPQKVDASLVAKLVRSYVAQYSVGVNHLASLITRVRRTLQRPRREHATPTLEPAVPIG
jgi:predicted transcriptional regulator